MRRSLTTTVALLFVTGVVLAACGSDPEDMDAGGTTGRPDGPSSLPPTTGGGTEPARGSLAELLAGRTFLSQSVTEDGADRPLAGPEPIRLELGADGRLGASGGCNSMSGGYEIVDDELVLAGDLLMTQMACEPALMDQDTWLAGVLDARPTLALEGDELTLTADGTVLVLVDREVAQPDASLTGTVWRLETIIEGAGSDGAASSVPAGVEATLELGSDGRALVRAGCNSGSAPYEAGDGSLTFGPLLLTRMACAEDAMAVEAAVAAVLAGEVDAQVEADRLTLTSGERGLVYRAAS